MKQRDKGAVLVGILLTPHGAFLLYSTFLSYIYFGPTSLINAKQVSCKAGKNILRFSVGAQLEKAALLFEGLLNNLITINYFKCKKKTPPHSRHNNLVTATHSVMILPLNSARSKWKVIASDLRKPTIYRASMSEAHLNINCNT